MVPNAHVSLAENAKGLKSDKKETQAFKEAVSAGAHEGINVTSKEESSPLVGSIEKIVYSIVNKKYTGLQDLFTEEGYKMFESLIESLAFGLGSVARKDIFAMEGEAWTDYMKMVVVTFLENYKTAFALKRLDFIETMFDDDAVIIVGHVVKKLEKRREGDHDIIENKEHVSYARKTKAEYIEQLRKCFRSNQFINIRFANTEVGAVDVGEDTYGIQLRQEYFSSSYGDVGYLYLMVDFLNPDDPIIKVRTWQPERKPDLTPNLPKDSPYNGIFSNGYFG